MPDDGSLSTRLVAARAAHIHRALAYQVDDIVRAQRAALALHGRVAHAHRVAASCGTNIHSARRVAASLARAERLSRLYANLARADALIGARTARLADHIGHATRRTRLLLVRPLRPALSVARSWWLALAAWIRPATPRLPLLDPPITDPPALVPQCPPGHQAIRLRDMLQPNAPSRARRLLAVTALGMAR